MLLQSVTQCTVVRLVVCWCVCLVPCACCLNASDVLQLFLNGWFGVSNMQDVVRNRRPLILWQTQDHKAVTNAKGGKKVGVVCVCVPSSSFSEHVLAHPLRLLCCPLSLRSHRLIV